MPPGAAWLSLVAVMLPPVAANGQAASPEIADPGGQVARFMQADLNPILRSAPKPSALPKDLSLQLVDYIDCTAAPNGVHPRLGDGRGGVRKTAIGAYRETGASAHSWFLSSLTVLRSTLPTVTGQKRRAPAAHSDW